MVTPSVGEVVLVLFPFSGLSQSKVRPAICIADHGRGDWICCQVTSKPYGDPVAVEIGDAHFAVGGLLVPSFARPGKLFTASGTLMNRSVGRLNEAAHSHPGSRH